jgi:nucleoside-diphosphate-sugar epimerase
MRVLVTGATGCLGGVTARRFALDGAEVTASGRSAEAGRRLINQGLKFQPADLTDGDAVDRLVEGHDVVVHCGALSSNWGPARAFDLANVEGTRHVVAAAERHKVRRVVFVSTPSLYFTGADRLNISERDPLPSRFMNAYAASKHAAEQILADAQRRGLGAITVRPRAIFGPRDTALLPRLLRVASRGWLPLIDGGKAVVDLTYVDNVAEALLAAALAPSGLDGRVYNVTNGEPWTVAALLRTLAAALSLEVRFIRLPFRVAYAAATALEISARLRPGCPEPLLTRNAVDVLARSQTLSIAAARRDLAYSPRVSVTDGINRTVAWWRQCRAG